MPVTRAGGAGTPRRCRGCNRETRHRQGRTRRRYRQADGADARTHSRPHDGRGGGRAGTVAHQRLDEGLSQCARHGGHARRGAALAARIRRERRGAGCRGAACRRARTPDMMPIIGPAPKHDDLWFAFGHAHHGLTLGPVTGRLIAEMMTGTPTVVDPRPFRVDRF
ncbi:MAG TPA: FAD-binding oxidoreductase [Paraburkholderia sp.]|uniref:NAD(P)/FAD-dependent oxidoreductase n=1 Tax=Paraburkholderia sp. TaxID=1926495 RepID=UPI002CCD0484|nr:FAD-binding oxidoreductase [Paraburkholderia sp.]HTR07504.1 FAD-binding oxidoreductase [Paraburkholderia sp.]